MKRLVSSLFLITLLFFISVNALAVTYLNDGESHYINSQTDETIWVDYETPGTETTVNILDGGAINAIKGYTDSQIYMFGGSSNNIDLYENSHAEITSGIICGDITLLDKASMTMSGGEIFLGISASGESHLSFSGGRTNLVSTGQNSRVLITGGSFNNTDAHGNSEVTISGGLQTGFVTVSDNSHVIISNKDNNPGNHFMRIWAFDYGQITIINGYYDGIVAEGNSTIDISGGENLVEFTVRGNSSLRMTDGILKENILLSENGTIVISGGHIGTTSPDEYLYDRFDSFLLSDSSTLVLKGTDFCINGNPVPFGEITSLYGGNYIDEPLGKITGTLLNGDLINNTFRIGDNAQIILIPEPCTLLLLSLGGLLIRKSISHE